MRRYVTLVGICVSFAIAHADFMAVHGTDDRLCYAELIHAQTLAEDSGRIPAGYYDELSKSVCLVLDSCNVVQDQAVGYDTVRVRDHLYLELKNFRWQITQAGTWEYTNCANACLNCARVEHPESGGYDLAPDSRPYDWPAVAWQEGCKLRGTGVVVGKNLVLVCYHQIEDIVENAADTAAANVAIKAVACVFGFVDGEADGHRHFENELQEYYAVDHIAYKSKDDDLAILALNRCCDENFHPPLRVLRKPPSQVHAEIGTRRLFALGHPLGMWLVMSRNGGFSPQQLPESDSRCKLLYAANNLYYDLDLLSGSSGSPVFVEPLNSTDPLRNTVVAIHSEGLLDACRDTSYLKETSIGQGKFCAAGRTLEDLPSETALLGMQLNSCPPAALLGPRGHQLVGPKLHAGCPVLVRLPATLSAGTYGVYGEGVIGSGVVHRGLPNDVKVFTAYKGRCYNIYLIPIDARMPQTRPILLKSGCIPEGLCR